MISVLDWVYPIGNKAKAYSVREVIGDKLALTAPDYTRLYLGMSEVEKITDSSVLFELGKMEMIQFISMKKERIFEEDFEGFVQDLIGSGRLDEKEAGIAKRMLDKGYDTLSDKQKFVFDKAIENNVIKECQRCGCDIPWCEMLEALDNGGYCNYCQHMMEKIDKE